MKVIAVVALMMVWVLADFMVFKSGADSFFWQYKTPAELELQKKLIEKAGRD